MKNVNLLLFFFINVMYMSINTCNKEMLNSKDKISSKLNTQFTNSEQSKAKTEHKNNQIIKRRNYSLKSIKKNSKSIGSNDPRENLLIGTSSPSSNCDKDCLECEILPNGINKGCRVCKIGVFLYRSNCFSICPDGTYPDEEWQVCRECDSMCPVCWGPLSNMCGNKVGVASRVVLIENEIKESFPSKDYNKEFISDWLKKLKIVLDNSKEFSFGYREDIKKFRRNLDPIAIMDKNIPGFKESDKSDIDLSPADIYGNSKISLDLPYGSFSKNDGVFIPIPSYVSNKINYVKNHWIFIRGQWNGYSWLSNWVPILPSFIKQEGNKNKLYYENDGYWIFNYLQGNLLF